MTCVGRLAALHIQSVWGVDSRICPVPEAAKRCVSSIPSEWQTQTGESTCMYRDIVVFFNPGCAFEQGLGYQGRSLGLGSCCVLCPGSAYHVGPKCKPLSGWSVLHSCAGTSLLWFYLSHPHSCHSCWYPLASAFTTFLLIHNQISVALPTFLASCCCFWPWTCHNTHSH